MRASGRPRQCTSNRPPVPVTISPTMASLPGLVAWLVGLTGIIGNTLVLVGIFDDGEDLMRGWMLERVELVAALT